MLVNYPLLYLHGWRPDPAHAVRGWFYRHGRKLKVFTFSLLGLSVSFLLLNGAIFILERGKMPLMTRINGQNVGLTSISSVRSKLQSNFDQQTLTLGLPGGNHTITAKVSGVSLELDKTIQLAKATSGWRRLPTINLFSNFSSSITPVYSVNQPKLSAVLASVINAEQKNPINAKLVVAVENADQISVSPAQNGYVLSASVAADQVANSVSLNSDFVIEVNLEVIYPKIKTVDLQQNLAKAKALARAKIQLKTATKQVIISDQTIRSLMTAKINGDKPVISLDQSGLAEHLKSISGNFYLAPVATTITLLDGEATNTSTGVSGQSLDTEKTAQAIISAFEKDTFQVEA